MVSFFGLLRYSALANRGARDGSYGKNAWQDIGWLGKENRR